MNTIMQPNQTPKEGPTGTSFIRKHRRPVALLLLILVANLMTGCHFYKVVRDPWTTKDIEALNAANKYFVLHAPNGVWHARNLFIDKERNKLLAILEDLPTEHLYYLKTNKKGSTPYSPRRGDPTYEVHLTADVEPVKDQMVHDTFYKTSFSTIPLTSINKVEVYELDKVSSSIASFMVVVGGVAAFMGILLVIALLTKSSCPFVYIEDDDGYHFVGEMFGGAIRPGLERDDYMPLPGFQPRNGRYSLMITNELKERQYTNLADLVLVDHPTGTQALMDEYGLVHTFSRPVTPVTAVSDNQTDYRQVVSGLDSTWMAFNDDPAIDRDMSSLTMTFDRPSDATTGKLVLHAKNSIWLDYIFGQFTEQFGMYYPTYQEKQRMEPAGKNNSWARDQGLSLSVYLKEGDKWTFVDDIPMVGPLASRDLVVPLDLVKSKGKTVTVMLTCGFMFWEVDYVAMDFSRKVPVTQITLKPETATDEQGRDVRPELMSVDDRYLEQPAVGNQAVITYRAPAPASETERTAFLHNRGYYEYVRDYQNEPNLGYLKSFRKAGAFTRFSKERYDDLLKKEYAGVSLNNESHEK